MRSLKEIMRDMPYLRTDPQALRHALARIQTLATAASQQAETQNVADADLVRAIKTAVDSAVDGFDVLQKTLDNYIDLVQYHCDINEPKVADIISTIDLSCVSYSTTEKFLQTFDRLWFSQMLFSTTSKQSIAAELLQCGRRFNCPSIGLVADIAAGKPDVIESISFPITDQD